MFHYLVTIKTLDANNDPFYATETISRLTALDKAGYRKVMAAKGRKHPDAVSVDVSPIEESEYRRRQRLARFDNRHED